MKKSVFMDTLGSMRRHTQAQNEEVKWKLEIDKDINTYINKEGLSIVISSYNLIVNSDYRQ